MSNSHLTRSRKIPKIRQNLFCSFLSRLIFSYIEPHDLRGSGLLTVGTEHWSCDHPSSPTVCVRLCQWECHLQGFGSGVCGASRVSEVSPPIDAAVCVGGRGQGGRLNMLPSVRPSVHLSVRQSSHLCCFLSPVRWARPRPAATSPWCCWRSGGAEASLGESSTPEQEATSHCLFG